VTIPAAAALALTAAVYLLIDTAVSPDAYIHRLLRPSGSWVMSVVPALIVFSFAWTIADLLLKLRVSRVNEADLMRQEVVRLPALASQEAPSVTLQRIRSWDGRLLVRPVGRRLLWLLQHLATIDAQQAHELIRHQSDLDADGAASGYRTVRLFIWAMPILGFIGTVLGISLAVGGFSDFLTTNVSIDEIDRVTQELGNVASGLSFAFDTTLLGLLGGLFASVVSTAVQAREERVLTRLEELGLRIIESAAAAPRSAPGTTVRAAEEPSAEFEQMMKARLAQLSTQMDQFTKAVRVGLDGFLDEWAKLAPEVERVGADLGALRQHLSAAAAGTDQLILETRVLLEGMREASQHLGSGLEASIGSVTDTVNGLGESLRIVSDSVARSLVTLAERVSDAEKHLAAGLGSLETAIADTRRGDEARARALEGLSTSVSDLARQLADLRAQQEALAPLLKQLAGPLELRLMPVARGV
jgi:biopolymer transport protein ExbB/TolQ